MTPEEILLRNLPSLSKNTFQHLDVLMFEYTPEVLEKCVQKLRRLNRLDKQAGLEYKDVYERSFRINKLIQGGGHGEEVL